MGYAHIFFANFDITHDEDSPDKESRYEDSPNESPYEDSTDKESHHEQNKNEYECIHTRIPMYAAKNT